MEWVRDIEMKSRDGKSKWIDNMVSMWNSNYFIEFLDKMTMSFFFSDIQKRREKKKETIVVNEKQFQ
jgi:hypothetical protein